MIREWHVAGPRYLAEDGLVLQRCVVCGQLLCSGPSGSGMFNPKEAVVTVVPLAVEQSSETVHCVDRVKATMFNSSMESKEDLERKIYYLQYALKSSAAAAAKE